MITVFQWFFNRKTLIRFCDLSAGFMLTSHRSLIISTATKRLISCDAPNASSFDGARERFFVTRDVQPIDFCL